MQASESVDEGGKKDVDGGDGASRDTGTWSHHIARYPRADARNTPLAEMFDEKNPLSIGVVCQELKKYVHLIKPEILALDEKELFKYVEPTKAQSQIRLNFWLEYDKAVTLGRKLDWYGVYGPCCSYSHFYEQFLKKYKLVSFMLTPPPSYRIQIEECLHRATQRVSEILDFSMLDSKGKVDAKIAALVIKVFEIMDKRTHGAFVQRKVLLELSDKINKKNMEDVEVSEVMNLGSMGEID